MRLPGLGILRQLGKGIPRTTPLPLQRVNLLETFGILGDSPALI